LQKLAPLRQKTWIESNKAPEDAVGGRARRPLNRSSKRTIMKKLLVLMLAGIAGFTNRSVADSDAKAGTGPISQEIEVGDAPSFSKALRVEPGGKLTVNVDRGEIRVGASDQDAVQIGIERKVEHAGASDAARILREEHVVVKQDGNKISITAHEPSSLGGILRWRQPDLNVRYEITVPRRFEVQLKTGGGGIRVADVQGEVHVETEGGGLEFEGVGGKVDGKTEGGGIKARGCKGEMRIKTEGGGIRIEEFAGPRVQAMTEGGSIYADFAATPTGDSALQTEGGSVTARLPSNAAVTLDAHTEGGGVRTEFPVQVEGQISDRIKGPINGGGPLLKLETQGGSIEAVKR
jgi:hypothetical protein